MRRFALPVALLALSPLGVRAEPYLAVQSGFKCGSCHVNPTGGGMRKPFGTVYAQTQLAARRITESAGEPLWEGEIGRWLGVGADLRGDLSGERLPAADTSSDFALSRASIYAAFAAIPQLLTFYVDEQVAPAGALNREAYALATPAGGRYTLKAGRFFLPYGLRLEDDTAFVRQATGINFTAPDTGIEGGLELPRWSAQLAVTNGTGGAAEIDSGKQTSLLASYVRPSWRLGASYNVNNAELGDRQMHGVFAGVRTGPVAWLAELDRITDDMSTGEMSMTASLLEADWRLRQGDNFKLTYERLDPDDDVAGDLRERWSAVWERFPMQVLQFRVGARSYTGPESLPQTNRDEVFLELHVYL